MQAHVPSPNQSTPSAQAFRASAIRSSRTTTSMSSHAQPHPRHVACETTRSTALIRRCGPRRSPGSPKSANTRSPAAISSGTMHVPVVTTWPALSVRESPDNSLTSQVERHAAGRPRTFAPTPSRWSLPATLPVTAWRIRSAERQALGRGRSEDEVVSTGVVGDELRGADPGEILDIASRAPRWRGGAWPRRTATSVHSVSRLAWGQVAPHSERKLRFGDPHVIAAERHLAAALHRPLTQQPAGQRAIDRDVRLPHGARRRDLPSKQRERRCAARAVPEWRIPLRV